MLSEGLWGEGGTVTVEVRGAAVETFGDPAGLQDLARGHGEREGPV
jgi:hypothetical protein